MSDASRLPGSSLPTLRQLQFLVALRAEGGFTRAAEAVGVTQPTLSAGIRELEAVLGVALVDRARGGASLTPGGEAAGRAAERLLAGVEALVREARGVGAPLIGGFRLGAIPTIAPFLLPRLLQPLKARWPQLRLELAEAVTPRLVEDLRTGALDAALIGLPYDAPGLDTHPLGEDEFLLAAPQAHPLAVGASVSLEDLRGEELLLLKDGHCLRAHALAICRLRAAAPELAAASLHTLVQLVGAGNGVTLLPRLAADAGIAAGAGVTVRAFTPPVFGRTIALAWRRGAARAGEARLLGEAMAAMAAAFLTPAGG